MRGIFISLPVAEKQAQHIGTTDIAALFYLAKAALFTVEGSRERVEHGYAVTIVPSGGIEQNGPHMALGKHGYIVHKTANRIARELGHALVTPVISFVREGN
jgi:hypothetical protein